MNQFFSDVKDQTELQSQSILRKMALIPIVRSKKIKEEKKEEHKRFNVVRHTMCIPTSTATLGVVCIQV